MTDQERLGYTTARYAALREANNANTYSPAGATDAADALLWDTIRQFALAMYNKAKLARDKYKFHEFGWAYPDWEQEMQQQMAEHVLKGDPRDTGWLSAIAYFHGWLTATPGLHTIVEEGPAAPAPLLGVVPADLVEIKECFSNLRRTWTDWRYHDLGPSDRAKQEAKNAFIKEMYLFIPAAEQAEAAIYKALAAPLSVEEGGADEEVRYVCYCQRRADDRGYSPAMGNGHATLEAANKQAQALLDANWHVESVQVRREVAPQVVGEFKRPASPTTKKGPASC